MLKIAHRSGPSVFPEQTVRSALHAMENGADLIEIDTRFASDGRIAVCHDSDAERVFGVQKEIGEMTSEEFLSMRHKDAPEYPAYLLDDYLKAGVKPLLIHVKEGGERINAILGLLKEYDYLGDAVLGISDPADTGVIKKYCGRIPVLAFKSKSHTCEEYADAGVDIIRLWEGQTNAETVAHVKSLGKKVWIMIGNTNGFEVGETSPEALEEILALEPDGILINDITKLK